MKTFSITDAGAIREMNQDFYFSSDTAVGNLPNLFIVADGMGGHKAGDYASRYTIERVVASVSRNAGDEPVSIIKEAINKANELLVAESRGDEAKRGMGTTLVIGTIIGNKLFVANIGDSRLYIVGGTEQIRQITRDHSLVDEMVRMGEINADEARVHPDKNIITRAVGAADHVEADFFEVELCEDDRILLCTDGLTNMVRDEEICDTIRQNDNIETAASQLVAMANANGGRDNITVMIIKPFYRCDHPFVFILIQPRCPPGKAAVRNDVMFASTHQKHIFIIRALFIFFDNRNIFRISKNFFCPFGIIGKQIKIRLFAQLTHSGNCTLIIFNGTNISIDFVICCIQIIAASYMNRNGFCIFDPLLQSGTFNTYFFRKCIIFQYFFTNILKITLTLPVAIQINRIHF